MWGAYLPKKYLVSQLKQKRQRYKEKFPTRKHTKIERDSEIISQGQQAFEYLKMMYGCTEIKKRMWL